MAITEVQAQPTFWEQTRTEEVLQMSFRVLLLVQRQASWHISQRVTFLLNIVSMLRSNCNLKPLMTHILKMTFVKFGSPNKSLMAERTTKLFGG